MTDSWTTPSTSPSSTSPRARWFASSRATKSRRSPRKLRRRRRSSRGTTSGRWASSASSACRGPRSSAAPGSTCISFMIAIHELAKVDASHGLTISAHTTLGTSPIVQVRHRRAEAALRAVPRVGQACMGGFGLTEPEAGSDAGGTRTTAVRKGDRYVLNGTKRFITHGGVGEIFVVTAVTDPSTGHEGHQLVHPHEADDRSRGARRRSASATSRRSPR